MEKTFTKSDLMEALNKIKAPDKIERELVGENGVNDTDPTKFAIAGAEALVATLLDGLNKDEARGKLTVGIGKICMVSMLKRGLVPSILGGGLDDLFK